MGLVHLIRHARPTVEGVLLGRTDPPLAAPLPGPLALPVETVLTSPLRRAQQTAAALFPRHTAAVVEALTEVSLGEWDGLAWAEIEQRWPEIAHAKLACWLGVTPPQGEPYEAVTGRAQAVLRRLRNEPAPIAIVAHAGINAAIASLLTGEDPLNFHQDYTEVKTYELR